MATKSEIVGFIFTLWIFCSALAGEAQNDIELLEDKLDDTYGIEKLIILNQLTDQYQELNNRKALKYGKEAVDMAERLLPEDTLQPINDQYFLKTDSYNQLGIVHFNKEHFYDAKLNFQFALSVASGIGYTNGINLAESYLATLDSIGIKSSAFKNKFNEIK